MYGHTYLACHEKAWFEVLLFDEWWNQKGSATKTFYDDHHTPGGSAVQAGFSSENMVDFYFSYTLEANKRYRFRVIIHNEASILYGSYYGYTYSGYGQVFEDFSGSYDLTVGLFRPSWMTPDPNWRMKVNRMVLEGDVSPFQFTVSANPTSLIIKRGESATTTITVTKTQGTPQSVPLSISSWGGSSGLTASFNPSSVTPNPSSTSILTISASSSASLGTFGLSVQGAVPGYAAATGITVTVTDFEFSISASPSSITVNPGGQAFYTVTSTLTAGSTQTVSLSASYASGVGLSHAFSPSSGNPTFTSTLGVGTASYTPPGTYTITITGTGGGKTHSTSVNLVVQAGGVSITIASTPSGRQVTVDGLTYTAPVTFTWQPGSTHALSTLSPQSGGSGIQYVWASWSDGGAQTHTYTVPSFSTTVTANFKTQYQVTFTSSGIGSDSTGTVVTVNGAAKTQSQLPFTAWYDSGSTINYDFSATVSAGTGKQYVWTSTSGLGQTGRTGSFSVAGAGTVTGTYKTQYQLTMQVNPSGAGTTTPAVGSYWYDSGSSVPISATPAPGYTFSYWSGSGSGSYSGSSNSASVTMNAPITETAYFGGAGYTVVVTVFIDVAGSPVSNVAVTLDGSTTKYTGSDGKAVFTGLSSGSHSISVTVTLADGRQFGHFYDKTAGVDYIASNPYSFSLSGNREIEAYYKVFTKIIDLAWNGFTVSGKLQDEWNNPLLAQSYSGTKIINRMVSLYYSKDGGSTWAFIAYTQASSTGTGSFSYSWAGGVSSVNRIAAFYDADGSENRDDEWFYMDSDNGQKKVITVTTYDVTIQAYCLTQSQAVSVTFTWDGVSYSTPKTFLGQSGSHTAVMPTSDPHGHSWNSWGDGPTDRTRTISSGGTYQGNYGSAPTTVTITFQLGGVGSDASGTILTIDGVGYSYSAFPKSFTWSVGSTHSVAASTPISAGSGKQYVFTSWTNGDGLSGASETYTTPSSSQTVTANFKTQYYLTVNSNPSGVDDPRPSGWYDSGAVVTVQCDTPVSGGSGKQYVFTGWSGDASGSNPSTTVTMNAPKTATANYKTQYLLTMRVNPSGAGTVSPSSGWYDAGTTIPISATREPGYVFFSWTGSGLGSYNGTSNPANVTMNAPITETANFQVAATVSITVTSSPAGSGFVKVDDQPITTPRTFTWEQGSTHTLEALSPVEVGGTRYVWASWSDGGAQSHTYTTPGSSATVTAVFNAAQYLLTVRTNGLPASAGSTKVYVNSVAATDDYGVSQINDASANGWRKWYNAGVTVQVNIESPVGGYAFSQWSGDATGTSRPLSIALSSAKTVTANYGSAPDLVSVDIVNPSDGSTVSGIVAIKATVVDSLGHPIFSVQYRIDSDSWQPMTWDGSFWATSWDTAAVSNGQHSITVQGTCSQGASGQDAVTVNVNNAAGPQYTFYINYAESPSGVWYSEDRFLPYETMGVKYNVGSPNTLCRITVSGGSEILYTPKSPSASVDVYSDSSGYAKATFTFGLAKPGIYGSYTVTWSKLKPSGNPSNPADWLFVYTATFNIRGAKAEGWSVSHSYDKASVNVFIRWDDAGSGPILNRHGTLEIHSRFGPYNTFIKGLIRRDGSVSVDVPYYDWNGPVTFELTYSGTIIYDVKKSDGISRNLEIFTYDVLALSYTCEGSDYRMTAHLTYFLKYDATHRKVRGVQASLQCPETGQWASLDLLTDTYGYIALPITITEPRPTSFRLNAWAWVKSPQSDLKKHIIAVQYTSITIARENIAVQASVTSAQLSGGYFTVKATATSKCQWMSFTANITVEVWSGSQKHEQTLTDIVIKPGVTNTYDLRLTGVGRGTYTVKIFILYGSTIIGQAQKTVSV
jgi:uncharacterized repeat protein (TIGR02543 family)